MRTKIENPSEITSLERLFENLFSLGYSSDIISIIFLIIYNFLNTFNYKDTSLI